MTQYCPREFSHKDRFGSYTMTFEKRILYARVSGSFGKNLAQKFCDDLLKIVYSIEEIHWGYLGDLTDCVAATPEARDILVEGIKLCITAGCEVDAYVINVAMAEHQLSSARKMLGIDKTMDDQVFGDTEGAKQFILNILARFEG